MRAFSPLLLLLVLGAAGYAISVHGRRSQPVASGGQHGSRAAWRPPTRRPVPRSATAREDPVTLTGPADPAPADAPNGQAGLAAMLERWMHQGLITGDQRAAILDEELAREARHDVAADLVLPARPQRGERLPATAEAIGYLGGVLATVGLALIVSRAWADLPTAARLAMTGATSAALLLAGGAVQEDRRPDPALTRLRWSLWLAATATTALAAGVLVVDVLDGRPETTILAGSGAAAALSGALWRGMDRPVQQLTCSAGGVVAIGSLTAHVSGRGGVGLAVWLTGAALVLLGLRRQLPRPAMTEGLGAVTLVVGATITADAWTGPGMLLLVGTALGLLGLVDAVRLDLDRTDRLVLGAVGAIALLQAVPATLGWFSHDAGGVTGLVTCSIGIALVHLGAASRVRLPLQTKLMGGVAMLGGSALTGIEWQGAAPLIGLSTAIGLIVLGTRPGHVLFSVLGSVGLLINVPWAIGWFFPGEDRAPLLIMVSGALLIAIAVALTRMSGRLRRELDWREELGREEPAPQGDVGAPR